MKKLDHPYILKLLEIIDDPDHYKIYLVMEYIKKGSLARKIEQLQQAKIPEETMRKYFQQLVLALEYCHDVAGIIHRDIKPDNILIDGQDNIKLADFGVSMKLAANGEDDRITSNAGALICYSPEAFLGT